MLFIANVKTATQRNLLGLPAFLNKEEAAVLVAHIERDRGDAQTEQFGIMDMLYNLRDWKVWESASYVMLNASSPGNLQSDDKLMVAEHRLICLCVGDHGDSHYWRYETRGC
jgi:hypothetical protein